MSRVLCVDDARLLAELAGTPAGRGSVELVVVPSPDRLLPLAREARPDAAILGEVESFPDPLEGVRELRADPATREVPVLYYGVGTDRERALAAGADLFVPRPVTRHDLREALSRLLGLADRVAPRWAVELPAEVLLGEDLVRGTIRDLSMTGAFLVLERPLVPGERGTLRFPAGGREMSLPVEVVRHGPGMTAPEGTAVRFVGLAPEVGAFLGRFARSAGERRAAAPPRAAGRTP